MSCRQGSTRPVQNRHLRSHSVTGGTAGRETRKPGFPYYFSSKLTLHGARNVSLIKFLLFGLLAMFVLLPAAGILMLVGLPIVAVLGLVGLPILGMLMLVGLPALAIVVVCAVALGLVFGLLGLVVGLGIAALKIAFFIALPILFITWLVNRVASRKPAERVSY
jgi:hypothetical protein